MTDNLQSKYRQSVLKMRFCVFLIVNSLSIAFGVLSLNNDVYSKMDKYVDWIAEILPFRTKSGIKKVDCINLVAEFGEIRHDESDFVNSLMKKIFQIQKIPIRYRDKFIRHYEPINCEIFMFASGKLEFCEILRKWSLTKISKYIFAIIIPAENSILWEKCQLMSHPNVLFFKNFEIYKLSSPYEAPIRDVIRINGSDFHDWFVNGGEILEKRNFKQRNLLISTTNCVPYQYWTYYSAEREKIVQPSFGDTAVMCDFNGRNLIETGEKCCENY